MRSENRYIQQTCIRLFTSFPLVVLAVTVLLSIPLLGTALLEWTILSLFTQCFSWLPGLVAWVLWAVGFVFAGTYMFTGWKTLRFWSALPIVVSLATLVTLNAFPRSELSFNFDISLKERDRAAVVEMLRKRFESQPIVSEHVVELPPPFSYVSSGGGEVVVSKNEQRFVVMFFMWRGFLDSSSGLIIYVSDNVSPSSFDPTLQGGRKIMDHWFTALYH